MTKLKTIISYLHPILLETREGVITPYLEVIKQNGKNILNSQNANYSFNGLDHIFKQLFEKINIQDFSFKNILILGMGAGNAIALLREMYHIKAPITTIEKDPVVIELAKKHFNIERHKELTILNEDAYDFVLSTEHKYDLIISDLFIDNVVPEIFSSAEYVRGLKRISDDNTCVVYNKMTENHLHKLEMKKLKEKFEGYFPGVELLKLYTHGFENSILYYNTHKPSLDELQRKDLADSHMNKH